MATDNPTAEEKWSDRPGTLTAQGSDKILVLRQNAPTLRGKNVTLPLNVLRQFVLAGTATGPEALPFNPTGRDLVQNDRVLYEVNGRGLQYAVRPAGGLKKADFGGQLPAPSPQGTDANYLFIPFGQDAVATIIDTTPAQLAVDQEMNRLSFPRLYRVLRVRVEGNPDFGDVVFIPLPEIYIWALGPALLNTESATQVDSGQVSTGSYDVASDTFTRGLVPPVQVDAQGEETAFYTSLQQAQAAAGGLADTTINLTKAQLVTGSVDMGAASVLRGNGCDLIAGPGGTVQLPISRTEGLRLYQQGGGVMKLAGDIHNSQVFSGSVGSVLATDTAFAWAGLVFGPTSELRLGPGSSLDLNATSGSPAVPVFVPSGTTPEGYPKYTHASGATVIDQRGGPGGGGGPSLDLLDLSIEQLDEVLALSYDDDGQAQGATPAWSRPGHEFEAKYLSGEAYHFYCRRGLYVPGDATTGAGPRWHRSLRLQP